MIRRENERPRRNGRRSSDAAFARSFALEVSGAVLDSGEGPALFGPTIDEPEASFAIVLGDDTTEHTLVLVRAGLTRPLAGTYPVEPLQDGVPMSGSWAAVYIPRGREDLLGLFVASGGVLEIHDSDEERLRGGFRIVAEGFFVWDTDAPSTVMLTGSFDAAGAPPSAIVAAVQAAAF